MCSRSALRASTHAWYVRGMCDPFFTVFSVHSVGYVRVCALASWVCAGYVRGYVRNGLDSERYVRANVCMCRVCAGYVRSPFSPQGYVHMALENNV